MTPLQWTVLFTDGSTEDVSVPDVKYQSDDHLYEAIADATGRPDEVDDFWPRCRGGGIP